ncbi:hypothetical protein ACW5R3_06220 [Bizionia sp. KMM 8389]
MSVFHYYDLPEAEIFVFDEFLVCQIREGMEITRNHQKDLNKIIQEHFSETKIGYISNRINSYSVDPFIYVEIEKIPNIIAMAIIPENQTMKNNAEFERSFYDKPYEIFDNLNAAINWIHDLLN